MNKKFTITSRKVLTAAVLATAGLALTACTTTLPRDQKTRAEVIEDINTGSDAAIKRLYQVAPGSRDLVAQSAGVLVFPKVLGASVLIGAEHGNGVLRVKGKNQGYYTTSSGSVGLQLGAQSKAIIFVFKTKDALDKFLASNGWTAGIDATVAVANVSANGSVDLNTLNEPVVGFVMTNAGLMAGVSLEGTKVQRLEESNAAASNKSS
ncbi:twin-arginine translocation pathway signal [Pusillimonas sp. MFBS29]|uniref:BPSL1445 family SYLF domain-containing lipoprotein n=1 Tax=Pusillimonas sp. MFBS29 TaxID=2886690 RepID=UPI001D0FDDBE|nr:YSC84-related protein [Pusillimonas sp. MFBS29]MCC2596552.1 twin-arginine translocation pathway signal [Pusillimonas sp. MFBS29]